MNKKIYTIGHSEHTEKDFIELLKQYNISILIDVRSKPYSKQVPWFNRENLEMFLSENSIKYYFGGKNLGGRPSNPSLYTQDMADYEKMAKNEDFIKSILVIYKASEISDRMCLMCAEENPINCHRCILIGRKLYSMGVQVNHIININEVLSQGEIEQILVNKYFGNVRQRNLLWQIETDYVSLAYTKQGQAIAYRKH